MMRSKQIKISACAVLLFVTLLFPPRAEANVGLIARGLGKTVSSVFQIPLSIVEDSTRTIFPLGVLTGAVKGTVRTLTGTLSGAYDLARGAAPYAKYAILFI